MSGFKAGDIVRYSEGCSALARLATPHAGGWHADHCLGGSIYVSESHPNPMRKASLGDIDAFHTYRKRLSSQSIESACKAAKEPVCGILAGEPEVIGERCKDGGKCHHRCKDSCSRQGDCVPLTASGLTDQWEAPKLSVLDISVRMLGGTKKAVLVFSMEQTGSARPSYWLKAEINNGGYGEVWAKLLPNNFDKMDLAIAVKDIQEALGFPVGAETLRIIEADVSARLAHLGFKREGAV